MTFEEASEKFKISIKALRLMQKDGLISYPLTEEAIFNLAFLHYIWNKDRYLKLQLSNRSKKQRESLIFSAGLTRVESYIFNRYLNRNGERLFVRQIADELHSYYFIPISTKLLRTIQKIRKKAYNLIYISKVNLPPRKIA